MSRAALVERAERGFPISEATVKRAEKGERINLEKAATLARLLGVSLSSLRLGSGPPTATDSEGPTGREPRPGAGSLVDRQRELAALERAMELGRRGQPAVFLVRGDPGIGKSRLLRELRLRTESRGVACYAGRGHEDNAFPYQPFMDALAPHAASFDRRGGPEAVLVSRFATARLAAGPGDGATPWDKQELFRALERTLVTARHPGLLALDDLQWCDRGSLELFGFLVRALARAAERREPAPLVIVGSYRPDLPERLLRALQALQREPVCSTLSLEGLSESDTFELIRRLGVRRPSQQLVAALHEATQGNPLFVQEVLGLLRVREELFEQGGFVVLRAAPHEIELPKDVSGAIASRAQALSRECRRGIERAAFLGRSFELAKLATVLAENEEEVLEWLEEAVDEDFLRNRGQSFAFVHPLVREVLLRQPIPARAQRIHREIAERLEAWYGDDVEHNAGEIANHLLQAGPVARTDSVMRFTRLAAARAIDAFDWDAAARFTEATLSFGRERAALSDREAGALHHQAGVALHRSWDVGPGDAHYEAAVAAYERAGDLAGLAAALNDRVRLADNVGVLAGATALLEQLEAVLERLGDAEAPLRGQILDTLATCYFTLNPPRARELADAALALACQLGDDDLRAQVSTALALSHLQQLELEDALDRWEQGAVFARRAGSRIREARCLQRQPLVLCSLGRVGDAERVAAAAWKLSETIRSPGEAALSRAVQTALAVVYGDLARAEELASETIRIQERRRYAWAGPIVFPSLAYARSLRGAWSDAREPLDRMLEPGDAFDEPGRFEGVARRCRLLVDTWAGARPGSDRDALPELPSGEGMELVRIAELCVDIELADALELPELAERSFDDLLSAHECGVVLVLGWVTLVPRALGMAAGLLGRTVDASEHFEAALRWARSEGALAEAARTSLDYARALSRPGPHRHAARAESLARQASGSFSSLGMWPFVERAQVLLGAL